MNPPRKSGVSADIVAADLTLAVGLLVRRVRSDIESDGSVISQKCY
ncbi:MarR family transcriptional regulator, partial [Burkholderia cepacia]